MRPRRTRRPDRLSPGVRWGASLMPGDAITREDIHNVTSMTYGQVYRTEMTGETLKTILEDVADNIFNPDPYYQQGGDMVRVGGMGFACDVSQSIGNRISDMVLLDTARRSTRPSPTPSAAGPRSTKAPKARRSGTWSKRISASLAPSGLTPTPRSK
jgi:2',3'-cyclic-nucleotide 2'-phosphodiesterase (5'-nucleotidase family)